jgi:hypothetical protein
MPDFKKRLLNYGIKRLMYSKDFYIASLSLAVFWIFYYLSAFQISQDFMKSVLSDIMLASITIATIVMASFAVIISFMDKSFIRFIPKKNFSNIIFLFEWNTYVSFFVFSMSIINEHVFTNPYLFLFLISSFTYLIISIFQMVSLLSKFGTQRSEHVRLKK